MPMLGVCNLGWQDIIESLESKELKVNAWKEIEQRNNRTQETNLSRGIDDLPVTPNPRWGEFNIQPLLYQGTVWCMSRLEPMNLSKPQFH